MWTNKSGRSYHSEFRSPCQIQSACHMAPKFATFNWVYAAHQYADYLQSLFSQRMAVLTAVKTYDHYGYCTVLHVVQLQPACLTA